ncbi:hypothetical protein NMY22_g4706 [Coprinellus aureogranulatus]|nr:hypothetical protein NMY22_g4706 [Coprinellus aureogranulatus]
MAERSLRGFELRERRGETCPPALTQTSSLPSHDFRLAIAQHHLSWSTSTPCTRFSPSPLLPQAALRSPSQEAPTLAGILERDGYLGVSLEFVDPEAPSLRNREATTPRGSTVDPEWLLDIPANDNLHYQTVRWRSRPERVCVSIGYALPLPPFTLHIVLLSSICSTRIPPFLVMKFARPPPILQSFVSSASRKSDSDSAGTLPAATLPIDVQAPSRMQGIGAVWKLGTATTVRCCRVASDAFLVSFSGYQRAPRAHVLSSVFISAPSDFSPPRDLAYRTLRSFDCPLRVSSVLSPSFELCADRPLSPSSLGQTSGPCLPRLLHRSHTMHVDRGGAGLPSSGHALASAFGMALKPWNKVPPRTRHPPLGSPMLPSPEQRCKRALGIPLRRPSSNTALNLWYSGFSDPHRRRQWDGVLTSNGGLRICYDCASAREIAAVFVVHGTLPQAQPARHSISSPHRSTFVPPFQIHELVMNASSRLTDDSQSLIQAFTSACFKAESPQWDRRKALGRSLEGWDARKGVEFFGALNALIPDRTSGSFHCLHRRLFRVSVSYSFASHHEGHVASSLRLVVGSNASSPSSEMGTQQLRRGRTVKSGCVRAPLGRTDAKTVCREISYIHTIADILLPVSQAERIHKSRARPVIEPCSSTGRGLARAAVCSHPLLAHYLCWFTSHLGLSFASIH